MRSFRPGSKLHRNKCLLLVRHAWLLHHVHLLRHHHLVRPAIKLAHLNVINLSVGAIELHRCRVKHRLGPALDIVREKPLVHVHYVGVELLLLLHHLDGFHLLLGHELLVKGVLRSATDVVLVEARLLILLAVSVATHDIHSLEIVRSLFP